MKYFFHIVCFLVGQSAFSQHTHTIIPRPEFSSEEEAKFSIYEGKGDSCWTKGNLNNAKDFFSKALTIRNVCRVQQKLNEINKKPVTNCPDLKTFSELAGRIKSLTYQDSILLDSLQKSASKLLDDILFGIPRDLFRIKSNALERTPTEAEKKVMQDSLEKMMNESLDQISKQMNSGAIDKTYGGNSELMGDEQYKNNEFDLAKIYYEESLAKKPDDQNLKKKIALCDKEIKSRQKKSKK